MKRNVSLIMSLFLMAGLIFISHADDQEVIQFDMDYARFRASDGWTLLELYFSVPREVLHHIKKGDTYTADYAFTVTFMKDDSVVNETSWQKIDTVADPDDIAKSHHIMDSYAVYLRNGLYQYRVDLKDIGNNSFMSQEGVIDIDTFSDNELDVSDIQLAYQIKPSIEKNQYVKNGYFILPNPAAYYGQDREILYYYAEIYNLSPLKAGIDSTYTVKTCIRDMRGRIIDRLEPVTQIRVGSGLVEIGRRKLVSLVSATFELELTVIDNAIGDSITQSKRFHILASGPMVRSGTDEAEDEPLLDEYTEMTEEELDDEFRKVRYITLGSEREIYDALDVQGKREFMVRFWHRRDSDSSTRVNEFKRDYFDRLELANARFSSGSKEGWRTDQGRILLTYGEPDNIERSYASLGDRESEIWHYYTYDGGIEFVFVDVSGYGQMRLVHSTSKNELQDYEWRDRWLK